MIGFQR